MKVAFYAPMKPPTHRAPSGDRTVARLLMSALRAGGHEVELASVFRAWEGQGDALRQERLERLGERLSRRLVERYLRGASAARPRVWFSYHVYHKAPDFIGPAVAESLAIPYVIAEASHAPKQRDGPWARGHLAAAAAIRRAAAIVTLNPADVGGLERLLGDRRTIAPLAPFLPRQAPAGEAAARRAAARAALAERHGLDAALPWLLSVAMMRKGDKLRSFELLAKALTELSVARWGLLIVGDGAARAEVEAAFSGFAAERVAFAGLAEQDALEAYYDAADVFVWPAINEAYGMALLEAQAHGLPVVAGRSHGVGAVVRDGETGLLVPEGRVPPFAEALSRLLLEAPFRRRLGERARQVVMAEHTLDAAAGRLDELLRSLGDG